MYHERYQKGSEIGDPLAIWRAWAPDVRGGVIDSGHHMTEEAPGEVAAALLNFLNDDG